MTPDRSRFFEDNLDFLVKMPRTAAEFDESKHPRDKTGQFGTSDLSNWKDDARIGETFFHGTSKANLDSILKTGIRASFSGQVWPGMSAPGHVYVSDSLEDAQGWAEQGTVMTVDRPPVDVAVLKVVIPTDVVDSQMKQDEHMSRPNAHERQFKGDIKPEWIKGVWTAHLKSAHDAPNWLKAAAAKEPAGQTFYVPVVLNWMNK